MIIAGFDPGPTTGVCVLVGPSPFTGWNNIQSYLYQSSGFSQEQFIHFVRNSYTPDLVAVEKFITGNGAGTKGKNADRTRAIVWDILEVFGVYSVVSRRATDIKPWATDKRLLAANILIPSSGMRHAADAARHAMYAAVKDAGWPDPLR